MVDRREQKDSSPGCALFCDVLICGHCYTCAVYCKRPCTCCSRPVLAAVKFHCVGTFLLSPYEILSLGNGVVKPLPGAEWSSLVCSVVGRKWKDIVAKGNMLMHFSCGPLRYWLPGCFVHFFLAAEVNIMDKYVQHVHHLIKEAASRSQNS